MVMQLSWIACLLQRLGTPLWRMLVKFTYRVESESDQPASTFKLIQCHSGISVSLSACIDQNDIFLVPVTITPVLKNVCRLQPAFLRSLQSQNSLLFLQNGWTPLRAALYHGHQEVADLLIAAGADQEDPP